MNRWLVVIVLLTGLACSSESSPTLAPDAGPPDAGPQGPFPTPGWVQDAIIYEVFVRQFSEEGTLDAVTARVPELKALGVNTLWLMPIYPIGEARRKGPVGSPYSVRDYTAIDPAAGTEEDLRELVAAVHAEGMHIIFDWVANHSAFDNPWAINNPEWYAQDSSGNIIHPAGTDWTDVADLTYDEPAQRAAMIDALRYWVEEFDIDGYRCDVADRVPTDFWMDAIAALHDLKPIVMLAEESRFRIHEPGFDLSYPWPEYEALTSVFAGASATELMEEVDQQLRRLAPGALRIRYTTNHDETAFRGTPAELFGGVDGAQAAFVLMASVAGVPLLYNGQEVGSADRTDLFDKDPINFDQNPQVRQFYQRFLSAYAASDALRSGTNVFLAPDEEDVVIVERTHETERVVVIVNVRSGGETVTFPSLVLGTYVDLMTEEQVELGATLTLSGYGFRILRAM